MAELVALFGGGGFIGRYVAQVLLRQGARVRVIGPVPRKAYAVKPLGGLGMTQFVAADVTKPDTVARAVAGADAVVNLVGILSGDFRKIHVEGARHVAEAASAAGARALVQVSAIGADPQSPSAYGRSKAEGEAAVHAAFAGATIVRPSIVFGQEDAFINRFARLIARAPVVPVLSPATRFQPVYAADVAHAIAAAALDPRCHGGAIYELGGPDIFTMAQLLRETAGMIGRDPRFLELPDSFGSMMASFGFLPGAPITRDQWLMLKRDSVVAADARGFDAFDLRPTPLAAVAPGWLVRYRRGGRFGVERRTSGF